MTWLLDLSILCQKIKFVINILLNFVAEFIVQEAQGAACLRGSSFAGRLHREVQDGHMDVFCK